MASEIDRILHPRPITNLRQRMPPVTCMIWRGGDRYDKITFDHRNQKQVYPFDTIDTIKRMLCAQFEDDPVFIPRFLFVGVPLQGHFLINLLHWRQRTIPLTICGIQLDQPIQQKPMRCFIP